MTADVLPLDLPGTRAATSTPLGDVVRSFSDSLPDDLDAADRVLVVMVEQLAATIDAAARTGRASAAAMAAREVREAIAHLQDRGASPDPTEDDFADFRSYMLGAVDSSGTG